MREVCAMLSGKAVEPAGVPLRHALRLKFAQLNSADVERSFSKRKAILRPNRRRLTTDNLEMHLVINHYFSVVNADENDEMETET
jgi:hypothetical protein